MIFRPLCLLPSAVLFTLTIWPFGPPPPWSPQRWWPHKELCFDWTAGVSTGVFLSIRANVRPPSPQWIPTKLTSSPTSSYSAPASVSTPSQLFLGCSNLQSNLLVLGSRLRFNPLPTFLGVTFDRTLSFSKHVSSLRAKFFPRLKALRCIFDSSWGPSKESLSVLYKSFFRPLLTYASPGWFPFPKRYQSHQIGTPPPSGQSHHHRLPLILPYPTSPLRGFSTSPTSHSDSFHSHIL